MPLTAVEAERGRMRCNVCSYRHSTVLAACVTQMLLARQCQSNGRCTPAGRQLCYTALRIRGLILARGPTLHGSGQHEILISAFKGHG